MKATAKIIWIADNKIANIKNGMEERVTVDYDYVDDDTNEIEYIENEIADKYHKSFFNNRDFKIVSII